MTGNLHPGTLLMPLVKGEHNWNLIPSKVLRLDASDASTITESLGSVSQWDDQAVNGNDVTQGTGSAQPTTNSSTIGGKNAISFDGGDYLARTDGSQIGLDLTGDATFFAVINPSDTSTSRQIFCKSDIGDPNQGYRWRINDNDTISMFIRTDAGFQGVTSTNPIPIATPSIQTATIDIGNVGTFYTNGVLNGGGAINGTSIDNSPGPFEVGRNTQALEYMNGLIGEILIFDRLLPPLEIFFMHLYLSNKWGIQLQ